MKPVSKSEVAKRKGVSLPAVAKSCREGLLKDALVGDRVDIDHPNAAAYLKKRKHGPTAKSKARPKTPRRKTTVAVHKGRTTPEQIDEIRELTIGELLDNYGTEQGFKDWLQAAKLLEEIQEKQLKNAEALGKVISRELVASHLIGLVDATNRKLLADAPKRIATDVSSAVRSGATNEEIEAQVRRMIGDYLDPLKVQAVKSLDHA